MWPSICLIGKLHCCISQSIPIRKTVKRTCSLGGVFKGVSVVGSLCSGARFVDLALSIRLNIFPSTFSHVIDLNMF